MFDLKHTGVAKSTFGSHSSPSGDLQTLVQMQGVIYKLGTQLKLTIMNLSSKINAVSVKQLQPTKTLVGTFWHFVSLKIGTPWVLCSYVNFRSLALEFWLQIPINLQVWSSLSWSFSSIFVCSRRNSSEKYTRARQICTHHFCFFAWPWNCPEEGFVLSFTIQPLLMHLTALTGVSAVVRALYSRSALSVLILLLQDCYWREPGKSPAPQENRTVCSIHPGIKCLFYKSHDNCIIEISLKLRRKKISPPGKEYKMSANKIKSLKLCLRLKLCAREKENKASWITEFLTKWQQALSPCCWLFYTDWNLCRNFVLFA